VIEKYVNHKETLAALRESWKKQSLGIEQFWEKQKGPTGGKADRDNNCNRAYKILQEWTPLNFPINEVLMEIKRDPEYEQPRPIQNTYVREENKHKFCAFHNA
jgi:hypothetical protein